MDLTTALKRQPSLPGLIGIERISFIYGGFTLIVGLFFIGLIDDFTPILLLRGVLVVGTLALWRLYKWYPCDATYVIRVFFQIALLAFWYPDIYNFARFQPNLDHAFAVAEQEIFNCQPSILFNQWLPGFFWSELFNMGYFSYYFLIIIVIIWATLFHFRRFDKTTVIILCSFLFYFLFFVFVQSAGPQFYFQKIGLNNVVMHNFPPIGNWFRYHSELIHPHTNGGLFTSLVHMAQGSEKPIAAFPSSHVGISTIVLILAHKMSKKLSYVLFPFYCILCVSTVYIGAHYAIDVIAGWITAFLLYWVSEKIYYSKFIHRPKEFNHRHHHHHNK